MLVDFNFNLKLWFFIELMLMSILVIFELLIIFIVVEIGLFINKFFVL